MTRWRTVPPQAHAALSRPARSSMYRKLMFGAKSCTTFTVLPPRCAVSRRNTTRPNFDGLGTPAFDGGGATSGFPAGKPEPSSAAEGLVRPAPDGEGPSRFFFGI